MCKIFCVTNRKLCGGNFLERIAQIAACRPDGIILREKDLPLSEYAKLAAKVKAICEGEGVECILHTHVSAAIDLKTAIHLPLIKLTELTDGERAAVKRIGASCHSVEDAVTAVNCGADYMTAGHIYGTDCKKGIPGRGIEFLRGIVDSVDIPVYAIGGISADNISEVTAIASGAMVMSGAMTASNVQEYFYKLRQRAGKA